MKFNRDAIKKLRQHYHYTQTYVAQQLGISNGTYRQYEEGIIAVSIDRLVDIAQFYKVPIEVFFTDNITAAANATAGGSGGNNDAAPGTNTAPAEALVTNTHPGSLINAPQYAVSITIYIHGESDEQKVREIMQMVKQ